MESASKMETPRKVWKKMSQVTKYEERCLRLQNMKKEKLQKVLLTKVMEK